MSAWRAMMCTGTVGEYASQIRDSNRVRDQLGMVVSGRRRAVRRVSRRNLARRVVDGLCHDDGGIVNTVEMRRASSRDAPSCGGSITMRKGIRCVL